ncbi:hypothetical protein BAU15_03045 [Enterococcus sp. JM4C]|nr:hypothetical protein BAU15_03045 [Enterococcus sp. JM4C]
MLYSLQLGLSLVEFGVLQSTYSFIRMIGEVPSGMIADKFSRKNVLFFGAFFNALSALGLFLIPFYTGNLSFGLLVILFGLDAFASTLSSGTDQAMLFDYLHKTDKKDKFVTILSNAQILSLCMLSFATATGGKIFELGFSAVFLLQFVGYLVAAITILFFDEYQAPTLSDETTPENKGIVEQIKTAYFQLKKDNRLLVFILFTTLLEAYTNGIVIFIQGAFSTIGLTDHSITMILGLVTLFGIVGAFLSRYFTNIKASKFFLALAIVFFGTCLLISQTQPILMISGFLILNLLLDSLFPYTSNHMNHMITSETRATILSFSSLLCGLVSLAFYPILGWSIEKFDYAQSFLIIGTVFFLAMIGLLSVSKSKLNRSISK